MRNLDFPVTEFVWTILRSRGYPRNNIGKLNASPRKYFVILCAEKDFNRNGLCAVSDAEVNIKVTRFFKTLVSYHNTTLHHNPEKNLLTSSRP
jgi:hypothetical protein